MRRILETVMLVRVQPGEPNQTVNDWLSIGEKVDHCFLFDYFWRNKPIGDGSALEKRRGLIVPWGFNSAFLRQM